jgi:hypothetical protein
MAVDWQVNGQATPSVGQSGDQVGPQVGAGADPVDKQCRTSGANLDVAEVGRRGGDVVTMVVEAR